MYGPLLERGMSLHEIKKHTRYEILLMLMALSRFNVLKEGATMTDDMKSRDANSIEIYNQYVKEIEYYIAQTKGKRLNDDSENDTGGRPSNDGADN